MEFLVRIVDKGPNVDQSKAGDVIAVCPDGWGWTQDELTNPDWVIIRCPLTQIEVDSLLATPLADLFPPGALRPRRAKRLDRSRFDITGGTGVIIDISATFVRNRILDVT